MREALNKAIAIAMLAGPDQELQKVLVDGLIERIVETYGPPF